MKYILGSITWTFTLIRLSTLTVDVGLDLGGNLLLGLSLLRNAGFTFVTLRKLRFCC